MRTNEAGQFAFAVVPGDYQVEVAAHGFAASSKSLSVSDKEATLTNMSLNPGAQVSMQVTAVPLKDYATMGTLSASFGHWYTRLGYRLRHPVAYGKYLFHSH